MDLGLNGKSALVVGAGADIGRAIALSLAREGASCLLAGGAKRWKKALH